jgi:hypothetical protein
MRRASLLVTLVLAMGLQAATPPPPAHGTAPAKASKPPNIIFVLTDDLDTEYPDGSWPPSPFTLSQNRHNLVCLVIYTK